MSSKIIVDVLPSGGVETKIEGPMSRRELQRVHLSIEKTHRELIRRWRLEQKKKRNRPENVIVIDTTVLKLSEVNGKSEVKVNG